MVSGLYRQVQDHRMLMGIKPAAAEGPTFALVKSSIDLPPLLPRPEIPPAQSAAAIMAKAARLRSNAPTGTGIQPLRGKNLALLLGPSPLADMSPLRRAAEDLGARVAEVRFTEAAGPAKGPGDVLALARMLGRMYDAVECGTLGPLTARRIEQEAGVPVHRGLCLDEHPARGLADVMTLQELQPSRGASILFLGDPRTTRARRFILVAREAGFDVALGTQTEAASHDTTFLVDARRAPGWLLSASGQPLDETRRAENHRCVMQAFLLNTTVEP